MTAGAVRADEDGNLWIRFVQHKPIPGGPVYDIVSPEGELVNRIQLPPGYTLVGFGKGKVVYLQMRDATDLILELLGTLRAAIRERAFEHKSTPMIGRTHGVHAEPMTFGLKLALWYAEIGRAASLAPAA